ncbi:dimethylglycine demethylation protein DgcA [Pseudonocardia aurantiaca]|uniref:FAD-dependent oxidoreductase n=1 Tax=Pseudonocardia aurantiaca TaxID=75290 RepID=A0ABW4FLF8_9PSEU
MRLGSDGTNTDGTAPGETAFPLLFSPVRIGRTEVRNRVVLTAHGTSEAFRHPGMSPASYIEYLRRRAAGGAGLIICQPILSDPLSTITDETVDRHGRLVEAVRAEGATFLLQLTHLGAYARSEADVRRPPLLGFENTQSAAGETTHRMTHAEIELMIEGYRRTAAMAATAGFDGVEVHGAHGYLAQQSLTPSLNSRDDEWGQDRTLFVRRLLAAARAEMGPDRIVGYRTPTDDLRSPEDGGIGFAGIVEIVRTVLATGTVDVLNTTIGDGGASYARAIPNYRYGEAPNIPPLARLRSALQIDVPVIGVGRITAPGVAESVLANGSCDLVAMTRAHIADPDLLAKTRSGNAHRIRPCVGANVCVNRKLQGYPEISCFHNPEVLRETELAVRPADTQRHVLVVGAGPAGLKAADTAAAGGHRVTVVDAGPRPGGRLRAAEKTAALGLVSTVDHLVSELGERGVTIRTGTVADEALLRELAPDHVVLATGGRPITTSAFPDAADGVLRSPVEALARPTGGRVLVFDAVGANEGPLVAEALARGGAEVVYVTSSETVMPWGGALHRYEVPAILRRACAEVITGGLLGDVDGKHVIVVRPDGETITELDVDTIVPVLAPLPALDLVETVERLALPYTIVGDALAPRTAMHAFKEGHEAALAI